MSDNEIPTLETTIRGRDAWGNEETRQVKWRPLIVSGVIPALDDAGRPPTLWETVNDPPVYFRLHPSLGYLELEECIDQVTGDEQVVCTPIRVYSEDDLAEGCYIIIGECVD